MREIRTGMLVRFNPNSSMLMPELRKYIGKEQIIKVAYANSKSVTLKPLFYIPEIPKVYTISTTYFWNKYISCEQQLEFDFA